MDVMTPDHERWPEFEDRVTESLAGPAAAARRASLPDDDEAAGTALCMAAIDGCNSHHGQAPPHEACRAVLSTMDGVDVQASLAFFEAHGGYCDCEVMLNVVASVERGDTDTEDEES